MADLGIFFSNFVAKKYVSDELTTSSEMTANLNSYEI